MAHGYGFSKAQRHYDNLTPEDLLGVKEPTDAQYESFLGSRDAQDWIEENRCGMDEVEFAEKHFDRLWDMCCEWLEDNNGGNE